MKALNEYYSSVAEKQAQRLKEKSDKDLLKLLSYWKSSPASDTFKAVKYEADCRWLLY